MIYAICLFCLCRRSIVRMLVFVKCFVLILHTPVEAFICVSFCSEKDLLHVSGYYQLNCDTQGYVRDFQVTIQTHASVVIHISLTILPPGQQKSCQTVTSFSCPSFRSHFSEPTEARQGQLFQSPRFPMFSWPHPVKTLPFLIPQHNNADCGVGFPKPQPNVANPSQSPTYAICRRLPHFCFLPISFSKHPSSVR